MTTEKRQLHTIGTKVRMTMRVMCLRELQIGEEAIVKFVSAHRGAALYLLEMTDGTLARCVPAHAVEAIQ